MGPMMTQSDLDADWAYEQAKQEHDATHRLDQAGRPKYDDCEWCDQEAQELAAEVRATRAHGHA